jgi:hypothetical protein
MKGRTVLQRITDTLESAGIGIVSIETWPADPENDNRTSVSLVIRGESKAEALVRCFAELYLEKNNASFERLENVYRTYEQVIGPANPDKLVREKFLRVLKNYVDGIKYTIDRIPGKEGYVHCLENIQLVKNAFSDIPPCDPDQKTASAIDAISADKAPDDPPAIRNPCGECASGDCDNCVVKDSIPIKLYTPEEAAAALKKGRVLRNEKGDKFSYAKSQFWGMGFYREDKDGHFYVAHDLSGLYEEGKYV